MTMRRVDGRWEPERRLRGTGVELDELRARVAQGLYRRSSAEIAEALLERMRRRDPERPGPDGRADWATELLRVWSGCHERVM